jgi:hypothetical protein
MIQAALDINNHLLKKHFQIAKKTNSDGFLEMGQFGVLTPELAHEINKSGSFRNRLALPNLLRMAIEVTAKGASFLMTLIRRMRQKVKGKVRRDNAADQSMNEVTNLDRLGQLRVLGLRKLEILTRIPPAKQCFSRGRFQLPTE